MLTVSTYCVPLSNTNTQLLKSLRKKTVKLLPFGGTKITDTCLCFYLKQSLEASFKVAATILAAFCNKQIYVRFGTFYKGNFHVYMCFIFVSVSIFFHLMPAGTFSRNHSY